MTGYLKEKEVIKVLMRCRNSYNSDCCERCAFYREDNCIEKLCSEALLLISKKDAEINILRSENNRLLQKQQEPKLIKRPNPSPKRKGCRAVVCVETGEVFPTLKEAGENKNVQRTNIWGCCNGKCESCGGYHWRYATEEETKSLDLINRQQAEIDILIRKKENLRDEICVLQAENERLREIEYMYNDLCR